MEVQNCSLSRRKGLQPALQQAPLKLPMLWWSSGQTEILTQRASVRGRSGANKTPI